MSHRDYPAQSTDPGEPSNIPSLFSNTCTPSITLAKPVKTGRGTQRSRSLAVTFHALEPAAPANSFRSAEFPLRDVLNTIKELDRSADSYRIANGLFATETFCHVHDDGPMTLIGAYTKDLVSRLLLEYKGDLAEIRLRDGEGSVDAMYAMMFPGDVVGILRTSAKAPGPATFSSWMSAQGGHPFYLSAIPDPSVLEHLRKRRGLIRKIELAVNRSLISRVDPAAKALGVGAGLRAIADGNDAISMIDLTLRNVERTIRSRLDAGVEDFVLEFADVIPDFRRLKVYFTNEASPLDLRRSYVATKVNVRLTGSKRVGPNEAAEALLEAYDNEESSIQAGLQTWRSRRR